MSAVRRYVADVWPSLPRPVWILQAGTAVNMFGFGLLLPFEIIYYHDHRGFSLPVAGLILSTGTATNMLMALPAGALIDRIGGKRILFLGMVVNALAYGSIAFVTRPWEAFLAAFGFGLGSGVNQPAGSSLITALTTRDERIASFTFQRVALNLGIGAGGIVAGFVVAGGSLRSFQLLYLLNGATFIAYLAFLAFVPAARVASGEHAAGGGYRTVLRHRVFVLLVLANVLFAVAGYSLFGFLLGPYIHGHDGLGARVVGVLFGANTLFIILAQLPITRIARGRSRIGILTAMCVVWALACISMIPAAGLRPIALAVIALAAVSIAFGIGECLHAVVIGPLVSELAPPALVGRYMALFGMSFSAGMVLGPTLGASLLALSPNLPWLVGAVSLCVVIPAVGVIGRLLPEEVRRSGQRLEPEAVAAPAALEA